MQLVELIKHLIADIVNVPIVALRVDSVAGRDLFGVSTLVGETLTTDEMFRY